MKFGASSSLSSLRFSTKLLIGKFLVWVLHVEFYEIYVILRWSLRGLKINESEFERFEKIYQIRNAFISHLRELESRVSRAEGMVVSTFESHFSWQKLKKGNSSLAKTPSWRFLWEWIFKDQCANIHCCPGKSIFGFASRTVLSFSWRMKNWKTVDGKIKKRQCFKFLDPSHLLVIKTIKLQFLWTVITMENINQLCSLLNFLFTAIHLKPVSFLILWTWYRHTSCPMIFGDCKLTESAEREEVVCHLKSIWTLFWYSYLFEELTVAVNCTFRKWRRSLKCLSRRLPHSESAINGNCELFEQND